MTNDAASVPSTSRCPVSQGFDPLAEEQVGNPWPVLAQARSEEPVFFMPSYNLWCVSSYKDAMAIYNDPITYSNAGSHDMKVPIPKALAGVIPDDYRFPFDGQLNTIDPPQHTRVRKLMQGAFSPRQLAMREAEIEALTDDLLDKMVGRGQGDLLDDLAGPLPVAVISGMLGIPSEKTAGFRDWAEDFFRLSGASDIPSDEAAVRWRRMYEWDQFIREFIAERRANPGDDVTSELITARSDDGSPSLTDDEILGNVLGLVAAGADTTTILITHAVYLLLTHPEQWQDLKEDRSLVKNAIEETMRLLGPVRGLIRTAKEDVVLGGVEIPAGAQLYLHVGSASRDESVFEDPDRFDIRRPNAAKHLGFGIRTHFCLGAPLARLELKVVLNRLADRLPDLELVSEDKLEYTQNMILPSPRSLPLRWTPSLVS